MEQVSFRFYAELNDFLSSERRMTAFSHAVFLPASVKDVIESLGVPHTEVDLILVNSEPVGFTYLVRTGDHISVYPPFTSLDVSSLPRLRPPSQDIRFTVDTHLGRLATYLRMLGFDALYEIGCDDRKLSRIAACESRILLTRDRGLLKRGQVTYGYFVRATEPRLQLAEVLGRFNLSRAAVPFQRCLRCNTLLQPISKESICDRLPPRTAQAYHDFRICPGCDRLYWAGSHYEHMQRFVNRVMAACARMRGGS
jgi:uncharacterized protein with PIN domain